MKSERQVGVSDGMLSICVSWRWSYGIRLEKDVHTTDEGNHWQISAQGSNLLRLGFRKSCLEASRSRNSRARLDAERSGKQWVKQIWRDFFVRGLLEIF